MIEPSPRAGRRCRDGCAEGAAWWKGANAVELAEELAGASALRPWLGRLLTWGLIEHSGRTNATRYFVPPALLREAGLDALTTLSRVQPHRPRALILEDLERFPDSSKADIWRRVGPEIPERTFRRALEDLVASGRAVATGSPVVFGIIPLHNRCCV